MKLGKVRKGEGKNRGGEGLEMEEGDGKRGQKRVVKEKPARGICHCGCGERNDRPKSGAAEGYWPADEVEEAGEGEAGGGWRRRQGGKEKVVEDEEAGEKKMGKKEEEMKEDE